MNIFFLHRSAIICAAHHCDKHVVKMILESAQILSTVHNMNGKETTYKPTHQNHPSVQWVNQSRLHYMYVQELAVHLCREYRKRYGKEHKCEQMIHKELRDPPDQLVKSLWVDPPQCMPESYQRKDTVEAYRAYYKGEKSYFAKWFGKKELAPSWFYNFREGDSIAFADQKFI